MHGIIFIPNIHDVWRMSGMALTMTQKLLIYGLSLTQLGKEEQKGVFLFLCKDEEKMQQMIRFLKQNKNATESQVVEKMLKILGKYDG